MLGLLLLLLPHPKITPVGSPHGYPNAGQVRGLIHRRLRLILRARVRLRKISARVGQIITFPPLHHKVERGLAKPSLRRHCQRSLKMSHHRQVHQISGNAVYLRHPYLIELMEPEPKPEIIRPFPYLEEVIICLLEILHHTKIYQRLSRSIRRDTRTEIGDLHAEIA